MSGHPSIRRRLLVMLISTILLVWLAVVVLVYVAAGHEVEQIFDADLARSARILHALLQHEVEEEQEMALKASDVIAELGAAGIVAYPRLAAILDEYVTLDGKEQLELAGTSLDAGHSAGSGGLAFIARYADGTVMMRDRSAPEIHGLLRALNKLFERVAATLRHERQFTADAAHELRTPLAALKTHLQVAQRGTAEARTRQSLAQALDGVDRATHSVEQLLLLARADADQERALVGADTDLRDVAVSVVSALSQQAVERDIDLGLDAPGSVCARGDASALQVLLKNLVDNAVRYTPLGGTVTVAVGNGHDGPWFEVADDGPGVAPDERKRIFSRFHRGAGEQAAGTNGSGLGLSIVRRIADLHGASIELGAGLGGRGLGVKVTFPRG